jgi:CubicO group peptidase (beta-lactamase class C family)
MRQQFKLAMTMAVVVRVWLLAMPVFIVAADVRASEVTCTSRFPGAEWDVASPESQGVDSPKLRAAVTYMDENFDPAGAKQLVIIRNGYLIWKGPQADSCHVIHSCTKVFTSTCLGLMLDDGKCKLDDPMIKYLPEWGEAYPIYAKVTLRHLATMTGGTRGKLGYTGPWQEWGDPVVYVTTPDKPEFAPAGSQVAYQDSNVHLLGRIVAMHLALEPLKDLFKRRIADPIGMKQWDWGISGTVEGMTHYNAAGTPAIKGSGGIQISSLELARFGLLFLNRGNWNGKQLLSASFVDEAIRNQVPVTTPGRSRKGWSGAYGFYWYTNGIRADGKRRWPAAPTGTYAAQGGGGNTLFVIPKWSMVVVRLGLGVKDPSVPTPSGRIDSEQARNAFFAKLADALAQGEEAEPNVCPATEIPGPNDSQNASPAKWIDPDGNRWILSNLARQQNLFRTLDGLTTITGDPKYKQAAIDTIRHVFDHERTL